MIPASSTAPLTLDPSCDPIQLNRWQARLQLRFGRSGSKTVLAERRHSGPLMVQKAFYPEGPQTCHAYIVHPPGGIVGGDGLEISAATGAHSHALITTPSATKWYRSAGAEATQTVHVTVGEQSTLEWLPQETIVYDQARLQARLQVDLATGARFIGWELLCLGLPASGRPFDQGEVAQHLTIHREQRPLLVETLRINDRDPIVQAAWGLRARPVSGVLVATVASAQISETLRRKAASAVADGLFGVTWIDGLLIARFLGDRAVDGLACFRQVWKTIRPLVLGRTACAPRIWNT